MAARAIRILGVLAVIAASVVYCLPSHPDVHGTWLDPISHIVFFLALAAALVPIHRPAWTLAALALLALALEVIQWRVAGFARLEWGDIAANEAGVALAAVIAFVRKRFASSL